MKILELWNVYNIGMSPVISVIFAAAAFEKKLKSNFTNIYSRLSLTVWTILCAMYDRALMSISIYIQFLFFMGFISSQPGSNIAFLHLFILRVASTRKFQRN